MRLLAAGLFVVLAACTGSPEITQSTPEPVEPTAISTVEPTPTPTPTPSPTEDEVDEARLEDLRAGRNFIELAEHDRAPGGRWSEFTYTQFGIAGDGELIGEWTNKRELWDSFVPAFRDECLLAGEPATEPMWDDEIMIPVGVNSRWNEATTDRRGHSVDIYCAFDDAETGEITEMYTAALIEVSDDGGGTISRIMETLLVPESDYPSNEARSAAVRAHFWEWIVSEPPP